MTEIDWPTYTSELLTLLDLIETAAATGAHQMEIETLACQRFEITKHHGFTIEWGGLTTGTKQ